MKIRHILIASAALATSPAFAQDVAPEATGDCATLQVQVDQAATTASGEQMAAAQASIDEGKRLCAEGRTEEGTAKLQEALSVISQAAEGTAPSQPTEMPQSETEEAPAEVPPQ